MEKIGEPDFLAMVRRLWQSKHWLAAGTFLGGVFGFVIAMVSTPIYRATATIAPKENQGGGSSQGIFAQLGGLGSMVASQLGVGQTSLDRLEIMAGGRELAKEVIESNDLLPLLFPERWDRGANTWKKEPKGRIPELRDGVERLVNGIVTVNQDSKRKMLVLQADAPDSTLAVNLVNMYLSALNNKIKRLVEKDAETNRTYLETQLAMATDPLLREKIQQLIAAEIEKSMLVGSKSFDVLIEPYMPRQAVRPKRKLILLVSMFVGFMSSVFLIGTAWGVSKLRLSEKS